MTPAAADFLAQHRGGGLFTETVDQRAGAYLALAAYRLRLAPTVLTLANLVVGLTASVGVVLAGTRLRDLHLVIGLGALAMWHLAYSLDCADGQLARLTGRSNAVGGRVDILCDVTSQIALVSALVTVASGYSPGRPVWLPAAFAGTWMVNLVTSVLQQGGAASSLVRSGTPIVRVVKLVRDFGAVVTVAGLLLAFAPQWMVWFVVACTVVNGVFLLASVAAAARASLGST
jgi:phosphatidylglycerophosphate synthase